MRLHRLAPTLLCVLLALALGLAGPASAAEKGVVTDLTWGISCADQDRSLVAIRDLGPRWAKLGVNWAYAEPTQGSYDETYLAKVDRAVNLLRASGVHVLAELSQAPQWASGNSDHAYPPQNPADFANFARVMAARYAGRVEAWQIWNEPNYVGWWPAGPNAAQYVPLLEAAYPAVKRGDPNALVVMGGLSLNDYDYLEQEYQAADAIDPQHPLGEYFDVMATHAYAHNNPPETVAYRSDGRMTKQSFQAYSEIRNTMLAHGDDKPQWLTEIGWAHASGPSAWVVDSDETAADYLTRAYDLLQNAPYVKVAFWYNLRDHYWASGDWWYDALGLMRKDFSPKATYWAFQAVNGPASGGSSSSTTLPCPSSSSSSPTTTMSSAAPVGTSTTLRVSLRTVTSSRRGVRRVSRRLKLRGRVRTASSGSVRLVLQRRTRTHHWRTRWKRTVRVSTTGRFSKRIRVRRLGRWRVRARYLGTSRYAPSKSRFVYFRTRPTR